MIHAHPLHPATRPLLMLSLQRPSQSYVDYSDNPPLPAMLMFIRIFRNALVMTVQASVQTLNSLLNWLELTAIFRRFPVQVRH